MTTCPVSDAAAEFDPFGDGYQQDPPAYVAWSRESEPIFYSYAYPSPDGFSAATVQPDAARFDEALGEFVLPYEAVRTAADPAATLLAFLESTYAAAAELASWDREALERVPVAP